MHVKSEDQAARGLTMGPEEAYMAWCRGLKASDRTAFEQVFRALHPPLQRYATHLSGDRATADDLVHDAFVKLWEVREGLDPTRSLKAFLFRTVRNLAYNHRRDHAGRAAKADAVRQALTPSAVAPDERADVQQLKHRLEAWIAALPDRQREALVLSRFEGLSHDEVASVMDVSPRTVNNHIVKALKQLRHHVRAYEPELLSP